MSIISDSVIAAMLIGIPLVLISFSLEKLIRVFLQGEISIRNNIRSEIRISVSKPKDVIASLEKNEIILTEKEINNHGKEK